MNYNLWGDNIWMHALHKLILCHFPGEQKPQNRPNKTTRRLNVKFVETNDTWTASETPEAKGISRASVCITGISQSNLQVRRFVHLCGSMAAATVRLGCGPASPDNQCPVFWDNLGVSSFRFFFNILTHEDEMNSSFKILGTNYYPVMQCHLPEEQSSQFYRYARYFLLFM